MFAIKMELNRYGLLPKINQILSDRLFLSTKLQESE